MLDLQWKELDYLMTNFQILMTSSAVLVGFGFVVLGFGIKNPDLGLNATTVWEVFLTDDWKATPVWSSVLIQGSVTVSAALSLAFNLLSLFIATVSSMCGPGMALRGPEGSVGLAVRHMEQQLKRSLRFFGRGVIAISVVVATLGLRELQDISFLGGVLAFFIGMWTLHSLWNYGTEIAEKFHVSPELAVRGTFVYGPGSSTPVWTNTPEEKEEMMGQRKKGPRLFKERWRPEGHDMATPLWRLDKMIAFPYYDEDTKARDVDDYSTGRRAAAGERVQMQNLVLDAQGPIASRRLRSSSSDEGRQRRATSGAASSEEGFDPIAFFTGR